MAAVFYMRPEASGERTLLFGRMVFVRLRTADAPKRRKRANSGKRQGFSCRALVRRRGFAYGAVKRYGRSLCIFQSARLVRCFPVGFF